MTKATTEIDAAIGGAIRLHRRCRGISMEALAGEVGVSYQQVRKYEIGVDRVSASRLVTIAAALEVPPAVLLPAV